MTDATAGRAGMMACALMIAILSHASIVHAANAPAPKAPLEVTIYSPNARCALGKTKPTDPQALKHMDLCFTDTYARDEKGNITGPIACPEGTPERHKNVLSFCVSTDEEIARRKLGGPRCVAMIGCGTWLQEELPFAKERELQDERLKNPVQDPQSPDASFEPTFPPTSVPIPQQGAPGVDPFDFPVPESGPVPEIPRSESPPPKAESPLQQLIEWWDPPGVEDTSGQHSMPWLPDGSGSQLESAGPSGPSGGSGAATPRPFDSPAVPSTFAPGSGGSGTGSGGGQNAGGLGGLIRQALGFMGQLFSGIGSLFGGGQPIAQAPQPGSPSPSPAVVPALPQGQPGPGPMPAAPGSHGSGGAVPEGPTTPAPAGTNPPSDAAQNPTDTAAAALKELLIGSGSAQAAPSQPSPSPMPSGRDTEPDSNGIGSGPANGSGGTARQESPAPTRLEMFSDSFRRIFRTDVTGAEGELGGSEEPDRYVPLAPGSSAYQAMSATDWALRPAPWSPPQSQNPFAPEGIATTPVELSTRGPLPMTDEDKRRIFDQMAQATPPAAEGTQVAQAQPRDETTPDGGAPAPERRFVPVGANDQAKAPDASNGRSSLGSRANDTWQAARSSIASSLSNLMPLLMQILQTLMAQNAQQAQQPQSAQPPQTPIHVATSSVISSVFFTVAPAEVGPGRTTRITWTSIGTSGCIVRGPLNEILHSGARAGSITSPPVEIDTMYRLSCATLGGTLIATTTTVLMDINSTASGSAADVPQPIAPLGSPEPSSPGEDEPLPPYAQGSYQDQQPKGEACDPSMGLERFILCLEQNDVKGPI